MNRNDITEKIIELSRKIAELWRMDIYRGCWIVCKDTGKLFLVEVVEEWKDGDVSYDLSEGDGIQTEPIASFKEHVDNFFIPIPTIHDVLRKLRELKFNYDIASYRTRKIISLAIYNPNSFANGMQFESESLREVLLTALLQVLESREEE